MLSNREIDTPTSPIANTISPMLFIPSPSGRGQGEGE